MTPPGGAQEGGEDEGEEFDSSDTLGVEEGEPLSPDTTQAAPPPPAPATLPPATSPSDTTLAAPLDTLRPPPSGTASPDTTARTPAFVPSTADSAARAARRAAAADSGDTLMSARPKQSASTPPEPKKPRAGILGIHPIAILLGLAALHYFVTKSAGD